MPEARYGIGQAVFLRTDTPDFSEETVPFKSLEEMVRICSQAHSNMTLEKVLIYSMIDGEPCALTLGFVACTQGQRPEGIELPQ